jgi:hypothetical protein
MLLLLHQPPVPLTWRLLSEGSDSCYAPASAKAVVVRKGKVLVVEGVFQSVRFAYGGTVAPPVHGVVSASVAPVSSC